MKVLILFSCLLLVVGFGQCKRSSTNPWIGQYALKGYDKAGKVTFTGTMSLLSLEGEHLIGHCTIKREKEAPQGLFDQNSRCEGGVEGRKVEMDLAPSLDDAGLLLEGQLDDGRISGIWKLDGFVTSEPLGSFEALKK